MAEFTQLPGTLDITVSAGDTVTIPIRLTGQNLAGCTFDAEIHSVTVTSGGRITAWESTGVDENLTVTVTAASTGDLTVSFYDLPVMYGRRWILTMTTSGGVKRCVVAGSFASVFP